MRIARKNSESGFSMIMVVVGLSLATALGAVAVAAVRGDIQSTHNSLDRQQAYEAARAGLNDYVFHLHKDTAYWTHCTEAQPTNNAINLQGSTAKRRPVPGGTGSTYAIELLPSTTQTTYSQCDTAKPEASMLESSGAFRGTFRIRSTGFAGKSKVAIVATFKPASFLKYVYFTQRETSDPVTYGFSAGSPQLVGVNSQCGKTIAEGRYEAAIPSTNPVDYCDVISFVKGDSINGAMHTNDAFAICENPKLGRTASDAIEASGPSPGWFSTRSLPHSGSTCTGSPNFAGTPVPNAPVLTPPPTNSELRNVAVAPFKFNGQVRICLNGTSMTVGGTGTCEGLYSGPIPSNGVVYVENGVCEVPYSPFTTTYPATSGCGNVYVKGNYSGALTIAAENDIIVNGSLIHSGEGVLGLVANNFVRVYHPYSTDATSTQIAHNECGSGGKNGPGSLTDVRIDAAILAINHSFIVDHYDCGASLGLLTVNGAIAQKFRGAVGTSGGTGYKKDYNYDDRLSYLEPPSFTEPVQSEWVVGRETIE
jgi:Tfp pilus assembly protein PilX